MKRTFFLLLLIIPFFYACSDSDKDLEIFYTEHDLIGTKWQTRDITSELVYGEEAFIVYEFKSNNQVEKYLIKNNKIVRQFSTYTYTLDYPILNIAFNNIIFNKFKFIDSETMIDPSLNIPNIIEYTSYKRVH